ncbi:hypothetical protein PC115_g12320 [Phytophthora cactorum]|uniref:Retrotransposon gag domain-containing protein n=1 Tax=Phytophthora cactorum TaxID=29920 RepID=A0A8T1BZV5_9STRA|nr:hypothetical protein PC115_g12320 [Phytophthora cactorum]KAG3160082.1 hypothetical protein C6341_g13922 [Phytophthora cactorum]
MVTGGKGTGLPQGPESNQFNSQECWYGTPASGGYTRQNVPIIGIPTELRNAVKVIVPFYSDTATSERAAAFWRSFEKCAYGMDGQMGLTAFAQCLKGKTPVQLWNRLKAAKRNRGESAEEWGDRIATMCEALSYYDPRMRYEFFLDGLSNKQIRAVPNASMVTLIREACTLLLYKYLHLPVEEQDEFAGDGTLPSSTSSSTSTQSQMFQLLQQMNQMMLKQQQGSGTHRGFVTAVAPTAPQASGVPTSDGNANANLGPLNTRLGPDTRTTEGEIVCGRCGVTATILWSATGRGLKAILETGNVAFLSVISASRGPHSVNVSGHCQAIRNASGPGTSAPSGTSQQ